MTRFYYFILFPFVLSGFINPVWGQLWTTFSNPPAAYYTTGDSAALSWNFDTRLDTVLNGDSVFLLPPYFELCYNCPEAYASCTDDDVIAIRRDAFFPNERFVLSASSWIFGTRRFLLINSNVLHQSWLADTALNLQCELDTLYESSVLGTTDSIRVYRLSNNDSILIGKNTGLIRFPYLDNSGTYLQLAGIHDNQQGSYFMDAEALFNWEVGDAFYYEISEWGFGVGTRDKIRYDVLAKTVTADSFFYQVQASVRHEILQNIWVVSQSSEQYLAIRSFPRHTSLGDVWLNNNSVGIDNYVAPYFDPGEVMNSTKLFRALEFSYDDRNGFALLYEDGTWPISFEFLDSNYHYIKGWFFKKCTPIYWDGEVSAPYTQTSRAFLEGIGMVLQIDVMSDFSHYEILKGYRKNGVETGFLPLASDLLLSTEEFPASDVQVSFQSGFIYLEGIDAEQYPVQCEILDANGRRVHYKLLDSYGPMWDTASFPKGFYIIRGYLRDGTLVRGKIGL